MSLTHVLIPAYAEASGGSIPGVPPVAGQPLPPGPPPVAGTPLPPAPGQPPTIGGGPVLPPGISGPPGPWPSHPIVIPGGPPDLPTHPLPPGPGLPPSVGGGKPAGIPILPMDPSWTAPTGTPTPPGTWVTLDAGRGQPPAWGYITQDHGLGPVPPPVAGTPLPPGVPPVAGMPLPPVPPTVAPAGGAPAPSAPSGHWVPVGTAHARPPAPPTVTPAGGAPPPSGASEPPAWAWVAEIGPSYGVKPTSGPK